MKKKILSLISVLLVLSSAAFGDSGQIVSHRFTAENNVTISPFDLQIEGDLTVEDVSANDFFGTTLNIEDIIATDSMAGSSLNLSGATTNRFLVTDGSKNVVFTGTSTDLSNTINDETGSGASVFSDSPTFNNATVGGNGINVSCSNTTTGFCFNSNDANSLTTGGLDRGVSNSPNSGTRNLLFRRNQNAGATGTTVATFQQDAANNNVVVEQNANGNGVLIKTAATTANSLRITPATQTSGSVISVPLADSLTSGSIINAVSASNDNTARNLNYVEQASTTAAAAVVERLVQRGPGGAFVIDRTNTASTNAAWTINDSNASSGGSIQINKTGTGFGNNVGLINIARTGNITGVDTQAMVDFSISPVFTFTESASGSNLYAGAAINMANVGVTPTGSTSTMTTALLLVGGGDGDANNYALISNGAALFQTTMQIGNSGNAISAHYSAAATNLTTASISAGTCGDLGTITVTGAAIGDTVVATPDVSSSASGVEDLNLSWMATVTASNTVTIRACNIQTVGSVDAGNDQEWRADVWHH